MSKDAQGHGSDARGQFGLAAALNRAQHGTRRLAAQHGISTDHLGPGGPIKVQTLDTSRAGQPWATKKAYGNRTVAETVAKGMRTDGGFMRIKTAR